MGVITFNYKESAGIPPDELNQTAQSLSGYREIFRAAAGKADYGTPESSINLPSDSQMHHEIEAAALKLKSPSLKYIIHIGIGGSSLGTQAVYEALRGNYDGLEPRRFPKIIFIDTNSAAAINAVQVCIRDLQSPEEVAVHVVSKSGSTTETIANFETVYAFLKERFGEINHRIAVTTDENSKLRTAAKAEGFVCLSTPQNVGGRYSVFSAAGILSLLLAGIDTRALCEGASLVRDAYLSGTAEEDTAVLSAAILHSHYQKGISVHNSFFFGPELESLGKWYRQLLAESIGKNDKGILPIVSIGSNDLHSVLQLYLGGPRNVFTTFVRAESVGEKMEIPPAPVFPTLASEIAGKDFDQVRHAMYRGVRTAYMKRALPFIEIVIPEVSAKTLGAYMQFKMMETMYLAHLLGVNAFDQPNVEEYKAETRKILSENI